MRNLKRVLLTLLLVVLQKTFCRSIMLIDLVILVLCVSSVVRLGLIKILRFINLGDNKIKFLALYFIYDAKFCLLMNYRRFIINLILSIVALYLIGIVLVIVIYMLSVS